MAPGERLADNCTEIARYCVCNRTDDTAGSDQTNNSNLLSVKDLQAGFAFARKRGRIESQILTGDSLAVNHVRRLGARRRKWLSLIGVVNDS